MARTEKVEKTISMGFILSLVIFGLININSYINIDHFIVNNERITHTHILMEKLETVLSLIKDAETGQRGYIITGKVTYLEPYEKGISEVKDRLKELRGMMADNEQQLVRMDELDRLIAAKFNELRMTIDLRTREGFSSSVRVIETNSGKQIMDSIRVIISEMKLTEQARLEKHLGESSRTAGTALGTLVLGNALAFVILVVSIALLFRQMAGRRTAEEELRKANESLSYRVEERTAELRRANEALTAETNSRMQIEEELSRVHKFESLGVLAGGIAHDFNNLLTVISGNIKLGLMNTEETHAAYKRLKEAEKASSRAADLTRQLLTFSRSSKPVKQKVDINALIRETAGLALSGKATTFSISVPQELPEIEVDSGQISQVIHNMLINADQSMPDGGTAEIRCDLVTLKEHEVTPLAEGRYIRVSISDTGTGISPEYLPKIFDPYFTTKQKGNGLGLAMSYSIISKHNGHISVSSEKGKGTTFQIYLPS